MARRLPGKKIDTWTFVFDDVPITVDVRLGEGKSSKMEFFCRHDALSLNIWHADINELKTQVREHLRGQVKMNWEEYFEITYEGDMPEPKRRSRDEDEEDRQRVETEFHWRLISIGTRPDGSRCWKVGPAEGKHNRVEEGMPETGASQNHWRRRNHAMTAILPVTPENAAALKNLRNKFLQLNASLHDLLSPKKIQQTVLKLQALPALGLPPPGKKR